jgi:uncharacterized membrane protein
LRTHQVENWQRPVKRACCLIGEFQDLSRHENCSQCKEEKLVRTNVVSIVKGLLVAVAMVVVMGCSGQPLSTREKGTFIGTGVGAATGAIIGAAVGNPLAGAAIGGGIGALGGYAVGNEMQNNENQQAQTQAQISSQQKQIESQQRQIQQMKSTSETE